MYTKIQHSNDSLRLVVLACGFLKINDSAQIFVYMQTFRDEICQIDEPIDIKTDRIQKFGNFSIIRFGISLSRPFKISNETVTKSKVYLVFPVIEKLEHFFKENSIVEHSGQQTHLRFEISCGKDSSGSPL